MDRNKVLAKNTLLLSLGQFVPKLITMLTLPILTTYLTKEEYGVYDLANSMVSLIVPLMTLQIQQVAFRFLVLEKDKKEKAVYMSSAVAFLLGSAAICFPLIFLFLQLFGRFGFLNNFLICTFLISESFYRLFGQLIRGLGYNFKYSLGVIVFAVFQLVLSLLLIVFVQGGIVGAFITFAISYFMAIVYMVASTRTWQYIRFSNISFPRIKKMLKLSAPIVPSSISLWIVNLSNRFIITSFLGIEMNAIFAVANKIPSLFSLAYTTFNLAWTESATLAVADADCGDYYSKMTNQLVKFLTGIMLLLIACTPVLFRLFINAQYEAAYNQMPILFIGVFFNSIVSFYGAIYVAIKRTKQVGISSALGALLNVGINLLLLKSCGILAASIATAVSYLIICGYRTMDLQKVIHIRLEWKHIGIAMIALAISIIFCYKRNWTFFWMNVVLAIIYNVAENKYMIQKMIKLVLSSIPKTGKGVDEP